jgi:single-strand DNA-binding protein
MTTITTIGRITKDVDLKKSEKGCVYANFSLAVNEGHGDNQKTLFFECTLFNSVAERLVKAKAKKGSLIQVTGEFGTQEFTRNNGERGYSLRITVLAWGYIPGSNGSQKDASVSNGNGAPISEEASEDKHSEDYNGTTNLDDE